MQKAPRKRSRAVDTDSKPAMPRVAKRTVRKKRDTSGWQTIAITFPTAAFALFLLVATLASHTEYTSPYVTVDSSGIQSVEDVYTRGSAEWWSEEMVTVPLYWQSHPDHPQTTLAYLTDAEIAVLKQLDLHDSGIDENDHFGPAGVMSLNGAGGQASGGTAGGSSSQGAAGASGGPGGDGGGGAGASGAGSSAGNPGSSSSGGGSSNQGAAGTSGGPGGQGGGGAGASGPGSSAGNPGGGGNTGGNNTGGGNTGQGGTGAGGTGVGGGGGGRDAGANSPSGDRGAGVSSGGNTSGGGVNSGGGLRGPTNAAGTAAGRTGANQPAGSASTNGVSGGRPNTGGANTGGGLRGPTNPQGTAASRSGANQPAGSASTNGVTGGRSTASSGGFGAVGNMVNAAVQGVKALGNLVGSGPTFNTPAAGSPTAMSGMPATNNSALGVIGDILGLGRPAPAKIQDRVSGLTPMQADMDLTRDRFDLGGPRTDVTARGDLEGNPTVTGPSRAPTGSEVALGNPTQNQINNLQHRSLTEGSIDPLSGQPLDQSRPYTDNRVYNDQGQVVSGTNPNRSFDSQPAQVPSRSTSATGPGGMFDSQPARTTTSQSDTALNDTMRAAVDKMTTAQSPTQQAYNDPSRQLDTVTPARNVAVNNNLNVPGNPNANPVNRAPANETIASYSPAPKDQSRLASEDGYGTSPSTPTSASLRSRSPAPAGPGASPTTPSPSTPANTNVASNFERAVNSVLGPAPSTSNLPSGSLGPIGPNQGVLPNDMTGTDFDDTRITSGTFNPEAQYNAITGTLGNPTLNDRMRAAVDNVTTAPKDQSRIAGPTNSATGPGGMFEGNTNSNIAGKSDLGNTSQTAQRDLPGGQSPLDTGRANISAPTNVASNNNLNVPGNPNAQGYNQPGQPTTGNTQTAQRTANPSATGPGGMFDGNIPKEDGELVANVPAGQPATPGFTSRVASAVTSGWNTVTGAIGGLFGPTPAPSTPTEGLQQPQLSNIVDKRSPIQNTQVGYDPLSSVSVPERPTVQTSYDPLSSVRAPARTGTLTSNTAKGDLQGTTPARDPQDDPRNALSATLNNPADRDSVMDAVSNNSAVRNPTAGATEPRDIGMGTAAPTDTTGYGWAATGHNMLAGYQANDVYTDTLAAQAKKQGQQLSPTDEQFDTMLRANTYLAGRPDLVSTYDALTPEQKKIGAIYSNQAQRYGVSLETALGVAAIESRLGVAKGTYTNDKYAGPGQIGRAEFAAHATEAAEELGRLDPYANIQASTHYLSEITDQLKNRGITNPTAGQVYAAYNQGVGGFSKLNANPDKTAASQVGLSHVKGNLPKSMQKDAATISSADFLDVVQSYPQTTYNKIVNSNVALNKPAAVSPSAGSATTNSSNSTVSQTTNTNTQTTQNNQNLVDQNQGRATGFPDPMTDSPDFEEGDGQAPATPEPSLVDRVTGWFTPTKPATTPTTQTPAQTTETAPTTQTPPAPTPGWFPTIPDVKNWINNTAYPKVVNFVLGPAKPPATSNSNNQGRCTWWKSLRGLCSN